MQGDLYLKTKLQQQMRIYDLNEDLKKVQKEAIGTSIKQNVLENLTKKYEIEMV